MQNAVLLQHVMNNLNEGVFFADTERCITDWNSAAENILGFAKSEILGYCCSEKTLGCINTTGHDLCGPQCPLNMSMSSGSLYKVSTLFKHKDGFRVPVLIRTLPIIEKDDIMGVVGIFSLLSGADHNVLIDNLSDLAMRDALTGLPNRRKIESHLKSQFKDIKRFSRGFCVVYLDIDDFSRINDLYGHQVGDKVLQTIARTVVGISRREDVFGRWGGEEFIGIYGVDNADEAAAIAEKIRVHISETQMVHNGENLNVTVSLGATMALYDDTADSIISRADKLMYQSKCNGKNCVTMAGE